MSTKWNFKVLNLVALIFFGVLLISIGSGYTLANTAPKALIIEPPSSPGLNVQIWTDKTQYTQGSSLQIFVSTSEQAYIYVLDHDTAGNTKVVFPNKYSQNNLVGPGAYTLPDGRYQFIVSGPPGTEYLQAIATTKKINIFDFVKNPNNPFDEGSFPIIPHPEQLTNKLKSSLQAEFHLQIGGDDPKAQFRIVPVKWNSAITSFRIGTFPPTNKQPEPRFSYWPSNPQAGEVVQFDASSSSDQDGYITDFLWDFDNDGTIDARGTRVSNRFYSSGRYQTKLTVQDNSGARASTVQTIRVSQVTPTLSITTPSSFNSNGQNLGQWYWCNRWGSYASWRWNSVPTSPREAYLNIHLLISNAINGGTGFDTSVEVTIIDQWGRVIEKGQVQLTNPFMPKFSEAPNNSQGGYDAYGSYQINNTSAITNGFEVKISWPTGNSSLQFAASRTSLSLAFIH